MIILTLRTDNPEAEIGLYEDAKKLAYETWHAHTQLSTTLHQKIADALSAQGGKQLSDLGGIVCFQGPGSFTGLRIGLTVGNALAYGLDVPIVAAEGEDWQSAGIRRLLNGERDPLALPKYGAPVHITQPKR